MFRIWGLGFRVLILSHDRIFSGLGFRVKRYKLSLGNEFWCSSSAIYSRVLQGFSEGCRASSGIEFWCFGIYRVLRLGKGVHPQLNNIKRFGVSDLMVSCFGTLRFQGLRLSIRPSIMGIGCLRAGRGRGSYISGL